MTSADPRFGQYEIGSVKVGPANWTHSNQFVCMVMDRTPCDYPGLPCRDGRIDSDAILNDPRNEKNGRVHRAGHAGLCVPLLG